MDLLFYASAKYLGYSFWCLIGIKLASGTIDIKRGLSLGAGRWLLGLVFGIIIFFLAPATRENVHILYISIYVPVRIVEWWIMTHFLPGRLKPLSLPHVGWILGGVAVSFLLDMTSPEMMEDGRFCVGRCLC